MTVATISEGYHSPSPYAGHRLCRREKANVIRARLGITRAANFAKTSRLRGWPKLKPTASRSTRTSRSSPEDGNRKAQRTQQERYRHLVLPAPFTLDAVVYTARVYTRKSGRSCGDIPVSLSISTLLLFYFPLGLKNRRFRQSLSHRCSS